MEQFSVKGLIGKIKEVVSCHPDKRRGNNLQYQIMDAVLGALSVFFMQSPSFLAQQRIMQEDQGRNNGQSLFELVNIPSDNQIRNILDTLPPAIFHPVFRFCVEGLSDVGILDSFRTESGLLILAIDGTGYYSSEKIHCNSCSMKTYDKDTDKEKKRYEHSVLTPVIVSHKTQDVIALEPEYILPQDGSEKQDCENKAVKRWINTHGEYYSKYDMAIVGDDLYAKQSICKELLAKGFRFILVCKEESHPYLYQWINDLEEGAGGRHTVKIRDYDTEHHIHTISTYRFANRVPLRDSEDALSVNWLEIMVVNEKTGEKLYHNSFITDQNLTEENIAEIAQAGRVRWHIENGNNNILKTKGYHFEHNYGHGKENLSTTLATLIIIAFLFHTMLHHTSEAYQRLREKLPRETFFQHIQALTSYLFFDNWDHLFSFMEQGLKKRFKVSEIESMLKSPG